MNKDRLQVLVSVTQILSSLAVLVSIMLLIGEYKRSGVLNEKSVEDLVYSRMMELDRIIIENQDVAEIISKAHLNSDSLTSTERMRYLAFEHVFYDSWESLWVGYRDGLVEESTWNNWNNWFMNEAKKQPSMAREGNTDQFDREFIDYLRSEMGEEY